MNYTKLKHVFDPMTNDIFSGMEAADLLQKEFTLATQKGIMTTATTTGSSVTG